MQSLNKEINNFSVLTNNKSEQLRLLQTQTSTLTEPDSSKVSMTHVSILKNWHDITSKLSSYHYQ